MFNNKRIKRLEKELGLRSDLFEDFINGELKEIYRLDDTGLIPRLLIKIELLESELKSLASHLGLEWIEETKTEKGWRKKEDRITTLMNEIALMNGIDGLRIVEKKKRGRPLGSKNKK